MTQHVWLAEAWAEGGRIDMVIHKNKDDAQKDIGVLAPYADHYNYERMKVHTGEDAKQ